MNLKEKLTDLFIPCTQNTFKPNFLERVSMGIMLGLILLSFATANIQALLWMGSEWMVSTVLPAVLIDLTNEERSQGSVRTLSHSEVLDRAAQMKADDMAQNEYFAHYSPTGVSPWYWFDEASYTFIHAGENLAVHFTDSRDVVDAWMDSPAHKANIMNGAFSEIGIGTARGEYKGFPTIFVVQLFGTPAASVVAAAGAETQDTPSVETRDVTLETLAVPDPAVRGAENGPEVAPASFETLPVATSAPSIPEEIPLLVATSRDDVPNVTTQNEEQALQQPDEAVVLYSDLATTSRPGVARVDGGVEDGEVYAVPETNLLERSATQSGVWLQFVYGAFALIVIVALILSIIIEWRRQNPVQIAYATGLLVVMALLFHIHTALTSGVTII